MRELIKQSYLILMLALIFGLALAFTDQTTANRIAQNQQQQIRELAQKATLGELTYDQKGAPQFKIELQQIDAVAGEGLIAYEVTPVEGQDDSVLGYAVIADGIGWDRLKILIGVSADMKTITGLEIVECRETPGLGERIKGAEFRSQYTKPTATRLVLVTETPTADNQVQAITGATISSTAVTGMVNDAVQKACKLITP